GVSFWNTTHCRYNTIWLFLKRERGCNKVTEWDGRILSPKQLLNILIYVMGIPDGSIVPI
ncbi:MAG: hypothetical protein KJP19_07690, partial [Deltaproteobacteria bacterium]|nr:hypothetical protein [Deltaproteobacteria bacterium]